LKSILKEYSGRTIQERDCHSPGSPKKARPGYRLQAICRKGGPPKDVGGFGEGKQDGLLEKKGRGGWGKHRSIIIVGLKIAKRGVCESVTGRESLSKRKKSEQTQGRKRERKKNSKKTEFVHGYNTRRCKSDRRKGEYGQGKT